ncbi:MAG: hypothetical protein GXO39_07475 [Thermotogae bacterium]|nr:hypothetical protein [Thermotogota bacterium]
MRKLLSIVFVLLVSCGQGVLPSKPVISSVQGSEDGASLEMFWYYLEGATRYEVKGLDGKGNITTLYSGEDTFAVISTRMPFYTVVAFAPSDMATSDTVETDPVVGNFTLHSYGSGFESGVCYGTDTLHSSELALCNPTDEEVQPFLLLILDSLSLVSPSSDTANFGDLRILYSSASGDLAPLPPDGYSPSYTLSLGDTVAGWIDRGVAGEFDLGDNLLKAVVLGLDVGDGSRDSITVRLEVSYQKIVRLRWY